MGGVEINPGPGPGPGPGPDPDPGCQLLVIQCNAGSGKVLRK